MKKSVLGARTLQGVERKGGFSLILELAIAVPKNFNVFRRCYN